MAATPTNSAVQMFDLPENNLGQGLDDGVPFRGPFFQEISDRKASQQDAKIVISADDAQTGVGKTHLGYFLAHVLDTSDNGFTVAEKATVDVDEFLAKYDDLQRGSALLLDEGEQIDSRRAMSQKNVDASFKWQTRRVNEICGILTLPTLDALDKRMRTLLDYWIQVENRGRCVIYKKRKPRFGGGDIWWQEMQVLEWPNMDGCPGVHKLDTMKDGLIDDGTESDRPDPEELEKMKDKNQDLKQDLRNQYICKRAAEGARYGDIVDEVCDDDRFDTEELSTARVSQIVTEGRE